MLFRSYRFVLPAILGAVFWAYPSFGSVGTNGADFLSIPVGGAPAALGGAYSALADNAYSPTWNPGGLGFLDSTQVAGQHLSYLESMNYEYASFVHPLHGGRSLGVAAQYLTSGDIPGTDPSGNSIGDFSTHYGAYAVAYGQKVSDRLAFGLASKWINAKISDVSANAYAVDMGGFYKARENLNFAATVDNIGSKLKFVSANDSLPLAFHLGGAYQMTSYALLAVEGVYAEEGLASFHAGGEWRPLDLIALRVGYRTDTIKGLSALAGFSTGLALDFWGQEFSYAWLPYGDLGNTNYFSLLMKFGEAEKEKRNLIQYQHIKLHRTAKSGGESDSDAEDPDNQQLMELIQNAGPQLSQGSSPAADGGSR